MSAQIESSSSNHSEHKINANSLDYNYDQISQVFESENEINSTSFSFESKSSEETNDSDDNILVEQSPKYETEKLNDYIFDSSLISSKDFNLLLTLFTSRFNLSFKCVDELLKLIKFVLPEPNYLSSNFNSIIKPIELSKKYVQEYLCSSCWSAKNNQNSSCINNKCALYECDCSLQTDCTIELFIFDINEQLNEIIITEEQTMISYQIVNIKYKL